MKKRKSLVVTSLLFSTMILNPSVIQGVIVQADAANQAQVAGAKDSQNVDVEQAKEEINNLTSAVTATTKKITIKYSDSKNNSNKIPESSMDVDQNAETILGKDIPMPEGYEYDGVSPKLKIKSNKFVYVKVKKVTQEQPHEIAKSDIVVKYVNDTNANDKIADGVIKDIAVNATSVEAEQVSVPKGYKLVEGQKFAVSYGKVTVHVVADKPAEETQEITVNYRDAIHFSKKIPNSKMTVAKNVKKVSSETVPVPKGYEIGAHRLINIVGGKILVSVKPIRNNGHEVAKSDITVKYVNDTNANDKIADSVIKDIPVNITSIKAEQVSVPKGYKLVADQAFAVSNAEVTVHVVPVVETKEITVKYLDSTNNLNKIDDGKMTVAKNAKKVAGETVPLPAGYEISARRLITIKNGHILAHVKPIGWNNNHEIAKSDITVKYVNDKNAKDKIANGVIKDIPMNATSVKAEQVSVPNGYKLVADQTFAVSYGKVTVHVVPVVETKEITVKYLDSTNNMNKIDDGKMTVAKNARKVAGETVPLPAGYEISARRLITIKNGHILAHVKPIGWNNNHEVAKSDITVKYVNDKNPNDKIASSVIKDIPMNATSVKAEQVSVPKGYKLVADQSFAVSYAKVTVHVVPAEETKEITVRYLDTTNNMNKIDDGKMIVAKNARKVAGETVPLPAGYEISARRLITIKNGHILAHVKPIDWNNNHEVAKSDITVKYVNDKNANDKIADGLIKDIPMNATSVKAEQVSVPKGYKLVADQNFAVSYAKVTVHVVPAEETKEITVRYLDTTNNMNKLADGKMTVAKNAKKVAGETVPLPAGYEISARRLITIKNGHILAHVKPISWNNGHEVAKSDITVKYVNDKNTKDKIANGVIKDIPMNATSVTAEQVSVPKGYKLVADQKFVVSYAKVTVHVVPAEETKEITVRYLDTTNNMNKLADGKMTVAKNAKKVAGETVPLPAGYQISARRLITIKNGHILAHVKPVKFNNDHQVAKSDITVKYVNDKNANDRITDGVIKDIPMNATSVTAAQVSAPKGYKLVADQKFAVSYAKVTVHVVPETVTTPSPQPTKPGTNNNSATTQASFKTTIHFVDHKSGEKVHTTEVHGKEGQNHEIALPANYTLADGETNKISASKKKTTVSIKVVKKAAEGTVTEHRATLTVISNALLYSKEGKLVNDRALAKDSTWFTDKTMVLEGTTYYRVSTNEWVKANDVFEFTTFNKTIKTSANTAKSLYDSKGNKINDRALAANSSWFSDKSATINGKQMYRVATNEWVLASDLA